jgi:2-polyprenyl-3-methyl-5-hydroxy-6-metoxy-1,4-benzoquinol methylase
LALTDPESPFSAAPVARTVGLLTIGAPMIIEAFKTGGGVPWEAFGEDGVDVQGDFNRPWLLGQLGTEYLPAVADIDARLRASPPARVLDVACGVGWASIAIARAYPNATVHGIDSDRTSIERATQYAAKDGLSGRVKFEARDAAGLATEAPYDFAIIVEAVHDMSNPVGVLSAIRKALAPGASLVVVDERVGESFTAPGDEVERFMYAASVLLCLPTSMVDHPSAATGTVMRPATLRRYATEAGFSQVEILDLEHPMLRFYRLR